MNGVSPPPLTQADVEAALVGELAHRPDLLPPPLVDRALESVAPAAGKYMYEVMHAGVNIDKANIIAARKWRHGRRPVAVIPIVNRVLYRGVIDSIADDLPPRVRGTEHFDAFQNAPLTSPGAQYVVMTDISNFYSSINLDLLCRDLLQRTGRWKAIEWLKDFWLRTAGGFGGIPQMNSASDVVADTFANNLLHSLLRRGYSAWRYADDFRIACKTYAECVAVLEFLDEEARRLGLFMNERKTFTPRVERYAQMIAAPEEHLRRISDAVEHDLKAFDIYSWEMIEPEEAEVHKEAAARAIVLWAASADDSENRDDGLDLNVVLPRSLTILGVTDSLAALPYVSLIMRFEPQYTPSVAFYLREIAKSAPHLVADVLLPIISDLTLTKWQHLWLLYVMEDGAIPRDGTRQGLMDWMRRNSVDELEPIRCQATWSIAVSYDLERPYWDYLARAGTAISAPYVAASLHGILGLSSSDRKSLESTDKIDKLVYQWANTQMYPF